MSKAAVNTVIRLRGVRHNNLKGFDLDLPLNRLIVITGLSGSGKSSLAFDTLFAEGQRRYIETFSPYARQFFDRMDKPRVDSIEGIPPAIAIEQRNSVKTTRSTVGTMTEICDYMKLLWPHIAQLYCRQCGRPVRKDSPQKIWESVKPAQGSGPSRGDEGALQTSEGGTGFEELSLHEEKRGFFPGPDGIITFDLALTETLSLEETLGLITKQGYQRLLLGAAGSLDPNPARASSALELNDAITPWGGQGPTGGSEIVRIDEAIDRLKKLKPKTLTVIQDRLKIIPANRARFVEACEQAYHFGKGKLAVRFSGATADSTTLRAPAASTHPFSNRFHCAECDIEYREPSAALFSFNHPLGACPTCRGFGRVISIDYDLALPDPTKTLADGAVKPWQTGQGIECQKDLMKFCRIRKVPTDVPFERLPKKWQEWVIHGDADYGKDKEHEWPRAWYGVKGYFRWLESKAYKMHVRVLLSRYRSYAPCPDCRGKRFQPEALLYQVDMGVRDAANESGAEPTAKDSSLRIARSRLTLADFYQLPIRDALRFVEQIAARHQPKSSDPIGLVVGEVRARLGYLVEVGLGYLTLDRPTRTLSGGETERVNLTTCLGTRLVNTLYVLDEPSVGLHPRDTDRLIRIVQQLRDLGNTVVVVEHEASVIRAADQIVDLGPGHGESGGQVVFQGSFAEILEAKDSLTGQYVGGRMQIEVPHRRPVASRAGERGNLVLSNGSLHNLKNIRVEIPLGCFVCVTGVSGSGKTTLVREVLLPALEAKLKSSASVFRPRGQSDEDDREEEPSGEKRPSTHLTGWENLGRAVLVDQSPLGKTPRSNPAVYIGAFDDIREFFAQTEEARQRGLNASAFSFNSRHGQCERCRGAGFEKIEMQFLSDVFIRCPECDGRRYRPHILEVKVSCPSSPRTSSQPRPARSGARSRRVTSQSWSIADCLDATVDEAIRYFSAFAGVAQAERASEGLRLLQEVGLGYLRLGQPINTLSGGESQRLKLVSHLAEADVPQASGTPLRGQVGAGPAPGADAARPACVDAGAADVAGCKPMLFLFDEPTTGLHFDDVRVLLKVFQRFVDAGHSVVVIEHNLEVIKCADWVIDLGPDAGHDGGRIIAQGTPEEVAGCEASHTGRFLRDLALRGQSR